MYNPASCHLKHLAGQVLTVKGLNKPSLLEHSTYEVSQDTRWGLTSVSKSFCHINLGFKLPHLMMHSTVSLSCISCTSRENGGRVRCNSAHVSTITVSTEEQRTQYIYFASLALKSFPPHWFILLVSHTLPLDKDEHHSHRQQGTVITRLTKIFRSGIAFVSRNELLECSDRSCLLLYASARIH